MKKLFALLTVLSLLFASCALADEGSAPVYASVNNSASSARLNLRSAPDQNASSLGQFYNGTFVQILANFNDTWAEVQVGNSQGYMMRAYLQTDLYTSAVKSTAPVMTVTSASAMLRSTPSNTEGTSLGLFAKGTTVMVLGTLSNWYYVQLGGMTGYIASSALKSSAVSSSGSSNSNWNDGPVGAHAASDWTLNYSVSVATVKNPDAADRLHLRKEATTKASSLGKYYNGVRVILLGDTSGEFTHVGIGMENGYRLEGYMKTEFLDLTNTTKSSMPEITVKISKGSAPLYQSRSTESPVLGQYENGVKAALMGFSGNWAHILVDGKIGFMQIKYLK